MDILDDLAVLTGGQVISADAGLTLENPELEYLGKTRRVIIGKDSTTIISDANKDLLELKNKQKALKGEKAKAKNVTNALFVGSTADLQKMIKDMKK